MTRTCAIDIEAVPDDPENPEFDDASAWTVFAIALSFRPDAEATPGTVVLVRRSGSRRHERQLLCAAANWIADRLPVDSLLTYNGGSLDGDMFDLAILARCIGEIAVDDPKLATHIQKMLNHSHRDLFAEIVDSQPKSEKWPTLSESLEKRGIDAPITRHNDEIVDGALMPAFGERVLADETELSGYERTTLRKYAASDVTPLFALADCLDRERHAAAEADAITKSDDPEKASGTTYRGP